MNSAFRKLSFASDYMEGAHPSILSRLGEINFDKNPGYGADSICESARRKILAACGCPKGEVHFVVGGTQANALVIRSLLKPYQGVIAAESGHINVHEAGAIEAGGHKVLTLPHSSGKISAEAIERLVWSYWEDETHEHIVMPGMVYISQPTELGTLYSLDELTAISQVCRKYELPLYVDGARLAYGLACPENDVSLQDLGTLCDIFYIGGTKCGALFGEAVVIPKRGLIPHFFTLIKQQGALLAKGWLLGAQFDVLFTDGLYLRIGKPAIEAAGRIREALTEQNIPLCFGSPTNQIFFAVDEKQKTFLREKVDSSFWEACGDGHTILRFATSWATSPEDTDALIQVLQAL